MKNKELLMPNNRTRASCFEMTEKASQEFHISILNDMVAKCCAVDGPDDILSLKDGKVWYIPHHGLFHPKRYKLNVALSLSIY